MVDFKFEVNGIEYTGSSLYDAEIIPEIGDKFQVKYSIKDPKVSKLGHRIRKKR